MPCEGSDKVYKNKYDIVSDWTVPIDFPLFFYCYESGIFSLQAQSSWLPSPLVCDCYTPLFLVALSTNVNCGALCRSRMFFFKTCEFKVYISAVIIRAQLLMWCYCYGCWSPPVIEVPWLSLAELKPMERWEFNREQIINCLCCAIYINRIQNVRRIVNSVFLTSSGACSRSFVLKKTCGCFYLRAIHWSYYCSPAFVCLGLKYGWKLTSAISVLVAAASQSEPSNHKLGAVQR